MKVQIFKILKYLVIYILIPIKLFINFNLSAQNLIPNPGFEIHDTCPNGGGQIALALNWYKVENTPDLYQTCEQFHIVGVPYNYPGFQYAHSGCGYAGLYSIDSHNNSYREFFQSQLNSTLLIGTKYFISFNLSLSNGWMHGRLSATNKIGCKLSTMPYTIATDGSPATNNQATFYTDSVITDTLNWVKISGSFFADSAYNYISFGNFFDSLHTQYIIFTGAPFIEAYYYIDDICLSTDSLTCVNVTDTCHPASPLGITNLKENDLVVYPNPFSDYLIAENKNNNEELEITLMDMDGRVLWREKFIGQWRKNLLYLSNGMYFYEVKKQRRLVKTGKVVKI